MSDKMTPAESLGATDKTDALVALNRIRARADEPGTAKHHGAQYVEGMRCAANMLEAALAIAAHQADDAPEPHEFTRNA